jgi:hypothetical protein
MVVAPTLPTEVDGVNITGTAVEARSCRERDVAVPACGTGWGCAVSAASVQSAQPSAQTRFRPARFAASTAASSLSFRNTPAVVGATPMLTVTIPGVRTSGWESGM